MSDMSAVLNRILTEEFDVDRADINDDVTLTDLGMNSVAVVELGEVIQEKLGLTASDEELTAENTFGQVVAVLAAKEME